MLVFYDLCVIDLSKVSHCDASGLAVLIGTGRRARLLGGFLRLAAVSPQVDQGLHRTMPSPQVLIGSGKGCDLELHDPTVSRQHLTLRVDDSGPDGEAA